MTARLPLALLLSLLIAALIGCPTARTDDDDDDSATTDDDDVADDDDTIDDDDDAADDTSIFDVQGGTVAVGTVVSLVDVVVTGVAGGYGLYVSEPAGGALSGLWCYTGDGADAFVIGDGVVVTGMVEEFDGSDDDWADTLTEIDFSLSGDSSLLPGNNVDLPVPTVVAAADLVDAATAEEWEGVLVRIEDVTVVEADLGFGEWSVTGGARVDDQIFEYVPTAGEGFASITGVLTYNYGTYKIVPRDAADLVAAR